jgi:hypothetical protein
MGGCLVCGGGVPCPFGCADARCCEHADLFYTYTGEAILAPQHWWTKALWEKGPPWLYVLLWPVHALRYHYGWARVARAVRRSQR